MSSILGVDTQPSVYLGVWINWSRGQVLGSTLTTTQKNGALLVAFVALFTTFVCARLWRIFCFASHHAFSDPNPQDAVYHHRQAVLKNADNATAGLISWYQLIQAWRKVGGRPFRRVLPLAMLTLLMAVTFTAASLLSSRIASAMGQEVLVRGTCGVNVLGHYIAGQDKNPAVETSPTFFTVLLPFLAQRLVAYSNYALSCYASNKNTVGCNTFVKDQLPFTSDRSAGCPFSPELCLLTDGNLFLDTGYLNSHSDLGMNARSNERFLYRRTTHCAPLVTEGYRRSVNISDSGIIRPYTEYAYGPYTKADANSNITYSYPNPPVSRRDMWGGGNRSALPEYHLGYTYANVINNSLSSNRAFTPIDSLYRKDADITLLFLSSDQVISPVEINDPWYSAHSTIPGVRLNFTGFGNLTTGGFFADEPVSVLGCANQYQICYPDKKGKPSNCSRLGGKQELYWLLTSLAQSERQLNRTKWSIMSALTGNELGGLVQTLGAASLSSKYSFVSGVQGPLPDNQWQLDVEHWHAATLVAMQGSAVDAASGPSDPKMKSFWAAPANNEERAVCNNQKILSDAHSNFSVFGLAFTFALGGLIIVVSFMLESPAAFLGKRFDRNIYSRLEWCTNGTLQLQRLAQEEMGFGTWRGCTKDVPTTQSGEKLAVLDITDAAHPCFAGPSLSSIECTSTRENSREKLEPIHIEKTAGIGRQSSASRGSVHTQDPKPTIVTITQSHRRATVSQEQARRQA